MDQGLPRAEELDLHDYSIIIIIIIVVVVVVVSSFGNLQVLSLNAGGIFPRQLTSN